MSKVAVLISAHPNDQAGLVNTLFSFAKDLRSGMVKAYIAIDGGELSIINQECLSSIPNVSLIQHKENLGLTRRLNQLIGISKEPYIARVDAGDLCTLDRFESQISLMLSHDVVGSCSTFEEKIIHHPLQLTQNFVIHSSVMFKREISDLKVEYNERYIVSQDYELWLRLLSSGAKFYLSSNPFCIRRSNPNSITNIKFRQQIAFAHRARVEFGHKVIDSARSSLYNLIKCELSRMFK
jgi:hypothetical protein